MASDAYAGFDSAIAAPSSDSSTDDYAGFENPMGAPAPRYGTGHPQDVIGTRTTTGIRFAGKGGSAFAPATVTELRQQLVPMGSPTSTAAYSPVAGNSFGQNTLLGIGKLYTDVPLAARQAYAQLTGGDESTVVDPFTGQTAAQKRATDQPLMGTWGGKAGMVAGALPLALIPGANTYTGAALLGGGMGALTPTVGDESRLLNTGVGTALGLASKYGADKVSGWLTQRAAEPFMGWNLKTGNAAAAEAVGSEAPKLDQPAIAAANARLSGIFQRARDPAVDVPISTPTSQAVTDAEQGLNQSSRAAFWKSEQVNDLMAHLQSGTANAQQLGQISSRLGNEAAGEMTTKGGDRALGRALYALQDHVDDLVGSSIKDPDLAAAYEAARPQWRNLQMLTARPSILNSASGDINLTALGKYLQRADKPGYLRGGNQSDLYNAARWGQATGEGKGAPPFTLGNFALPWAKYYAMNNPAARALGGAVSRIGAPLAPVIGRGVPGLALGGVPEFEALGGGLLGRRRPPPQQPLGLLN